MLMASFSNVFCASLIALSLPVTFATSPLERSVIIRTPTGGSADEVLEAVKSELYTASLAKRDQDYSANKTLDGSWNGAVLLSLKDSVDVGHNVTVNAGIEIVCNTCYTKGFAKAKLSFSDHVNITQLINQTTSAIEGTVQNLTDSVEKYLINYIEDIGRDLEGERFSLDDFALPTFNYSFNLDISSVPQANLHFTFDGLELYMLIDMTLSLGSTYKLPLYTSDTPVGFGLSNGLNVGVTFTIDLILDVEGSIDISSGFHIKFADGLSIDIALFGQEVSGVKFNGARFEFLPVHVESAGVVVLAQLQLGIHTGLQLSTPETGIELTLLNHTLKRLPSIGGGIDVSVFATVIDLVTNVTAQPQDTKCKLPVVQSYQLALGAGAGATVTVDTHTWGPVATSTVPIWTLQLYSTCASSATSTTSTIPTVTVLASGGLGKRAALNTITTTTAITYTGVNCSSSGMADCPASLQRTTQSTATSTFAIAAASGVNYATVTLPTSGHSTVATTIPFGSKVMNMPSFPPGSPTSYTASSTTVIITSASASPSVIDPQWTESRRKLAIGLSVGLGVPFLAVLCVALLFLYRKRWTYMAAPQRDIGEVTIVSPAHSQLEQPERVSGKKTPLVSVYDARPKPHEEEVARLANDLGPSVDMRFVNLRSRIRHATERAGVGDRSATW